MQVFAGNRCLDQREDVQSPYEFEYESRMLRYQETASSTRQIMLSLYNYEIYALYFIFSSRFTSTNRDCCRRASIQKVLQFKILSLQLKDLEFAQFISRLSQHCGRGFILELLCAQFLTPPSPDNPETDADESILEDMQ